MIVLEHFTPEQWQFFSEQSHSLAFDEHKPAGMDRITYALMAFEDGKPLMYVTCREHDARSLYWQFGGAFPGTKGTLKSHQAIEALLADAKTRYDRVTCLIENTNLTMLKMAMKVGFRIVGIRYAAGAILVEHRLEFNV